MVSEGDAIAWGMGADMQEGGRLAHSRCSSAQAAKASSLDLSCPSAGGSWVIWIFGERIKRRRAEGEK